MYYYYFLEPQVHVSGAFFLFPSSSSSKQYCTLASTITEQFEFSSIGDWHSSNCWNNCCWCGVWPLSPVFAPCELSCEYCTWSLCTVRDSNREARRHDCRRRHTLWLSHTTSVEFNGVTVLPRNIKRVSDFDIDRLDDTQARQRPSYIVKNICSQIKENKKQRRQSLRKTIEG